ncbi:hypothetical protein [Neobacillus kokaensis]|uniref:Uncharacterized protein n=1 Tax=Neobacillus kokaensis TaxID=2759023 RepID=A0ABQ3N7T4_9BACI|nr:hypothetical protein [Neobacillus kokaensis]GHI00758.1 hypothetical protein AM1BK_43000 [Neobacillus kokaensis]
MSINISEIHVQTDKLEKVKEFLVDWLSRTHGKKPIIYTEQDSFYPFFENKQPALFSISVIHDNWITILHDSYEPPFVLADRLSLTFNCTVIQAIGQSTVDTYYLSVHKEGCMIRKFHCGEDTVGVEQEGEPFPFEKKGFGQEDSDSYFFDYEDMDKFCQNFGINLLPDPFENDGQWTIIEIKGRSLHKKDSLLKKLKGILLR